MGVSVQTSTFWWHPFTRVAENNYDFKLFHIQGYDFNFYRKYLLRKLIKNNGVFIFAIRDDFQEPLAVTAVTLSNRILRVHLFWSYDSNNTKKSVFRKVHEQYTKNDIEYVEYPILKRIYNSNEERFPGAKADDFGREIIWCRDTYYNFMRDVGVFARKNDRINC